MIRILFLLFFATLHCSYAAPKACWTPEQDMQLMNSIQKHSGVSWSTIAAEVTGKANKQCRERYMCHLDPMIDKSPLSDVEISKLELAVQVLGPKWGEISKTLFTLANGKRRTDLHLKNVWHSQQRSEVGGKKRKYTTSHKRHLEEAPTTLPQQLFSTPPSISANKKKKVAQSTITDTIFVAHPLYSAISLDSSLLLSGPQLLLNEEPLILPSLLILSSNVTHSGLVAPDNVPIHLPSNSVSDQQSLSSTDIVLDIILDGPELGSVFEEDTSFDHDAAILKEFNIKTLDQDDFLSQNSL